MNTLHFSIHINAPQEKVWHTMLDDATYRVWTDVFNPEAGSYYEGSWEQGADILFVGGEHDGTKSGMISRIAESRPFDFVSIQHLGEMSHGVEKPWYGEGTENTEMYENYTFSEKDGGTELLIELTSSIDLPPGYQEMFEGMWPKALEKLKELAEK